MPFRVDAFGDRWLLAMPHEARRWATPGMKPSTDTMAFIAVVDIVALGEALGYRGARFELRRIVEEHLRRGTLRLLRETRPRLKLDPVREPPPPPYEPIPDNDPIVDDPRALRILQCDPLLTLDQPLRFTFMIRGLVGRSTTLRITDKTGALVHARTLEPGETSDGAHKRSWDGRVDPGSHALAGRRLSAEHGPCRLEIRHDAKLVDEAPFAIAEPDYAVEFADLHFATDRAILLPLAEDPTQYEDSPRATPLQVIAALLEFAADHPEREVVVYGHADTAGSSGHNDELSHERARNVELLLRGDRAGWAAHCQQHYEIADFKRVHRWAAERFAWSTDPGPLDNEWTSQAKHARAEFRRCCDALLGTSLEQGVKQNEADWAAIFDLYEIAVAGHLECKPEHLAALRSAIAFAQPSLIGCGEHWPVVGQGADGVAERINRRVEVMLFQPGELPRRHGSEQPQGDELYAGGRYRHIRLAPIGSDEALLRIVLLDEHGDAMPGAGYEAQTRAGPWTGTADREGVATVPRALVDAEVMLRWEAADRGRRYQSRHMLATAHGDTDEGLRRRLANLGFERGGDPRGAVTLFQRFFDLPVTGRLQDIAGLINEWYSTGERPTPEDEGGWVPGDEASG